MNQQHDIELQLEPYLNKGLQLWLEDGGLRFKGPKELLNKELMGLLKANKSAIMEWLTSAASTRESEPVPVIVDEYPLAYTQGAIWMLYKFAPNSPAYNTTFACILEDDIDEAAVKKAFQALLIRHPVLRSTFYDSDLGPRQQVWDRMAMPLDFVDGNGWDESQLQNFLNQEADAPFDLSKSSCLRVKIIRSTFKGTVLIATIQHVGADLWALLLVAEDIKEFYQRAVAGEALSVKPVSTTYRQHVEWQQTFMESAAGLAERRYWQQQLQGAPTQISLPEDFSRPPVLQLQAKVFQQLIGGDNYQQIKTRCKQQSITPFVFFQGAFQQLIGKVNQQNDFLIGTPTMGRSRKGMDKVVGDFANPVVLRARLTEAETLADFFQQVRNTLFAAMEHQECPFPVVVQDCNPPRDSSRTPLFQLMFVWHQGNAELFPKDGFIKSVLPMSGPRGAPYDVMLAIADMGDHYELSWTYQKSLYQPETVVQFSEIMEAIVQRLLNLDWKQPAQQLWHEFPQSTIRRLVADTQWQGVLAKWLEFAGLGELSPETQVSVVDEDGQPATDLFCGQLSLETNGTQHKTPFLVRRNRNKIFGMGLHAGWGFKEEQLVDWRTELEAWSSEFRADTFLVLTHATDEQHWVQRLFVVGQSPLLQKFSCELEKHFDDIQVLDQWPLTETGKINTQHLRQTAWIDRAKLQVQLAPQGLELSQVVCLRQRRLLPSFELDESKAESFAKTQQSSQSVAELLQQRPDAWMKSAALAADAIEVDHIFDALELTSQRYPEKGISFIDEQGLERRYLYPQLYKDAIKAAKGLSQLEFEKDAILLLQMQFDERFFAIWWGAVAMGVRPLVVATPDKYHEKNGVAQKLYNVAHNYTGLVVAADKPRVSATREWLGPEKPVFDVDELLASLADNVELERSELQVLENTEGVAFLQLTSGSTGTPKAIQIRHRGILHHVAASAAYNHYQSDNVGLNWLPFDHVVPILTTHLKDVILGIHQIQLPTAVVLLDPILWIRKLSEYKVTHTWAPNFAFQRVVDALKKNPDLSDVDLTAVQTMMNAGEQVLASSVRAFTAALTPYGLRQNAVQPAFGMAEACTCMTYNNESSSQLMVPLVHLPDSDAIDVVAPEQATHNFVDLGGIVPGVEVRITDQNNQLVKEGVIGRMQIRGPVITPGYLNNPEANAEAFVGDGWFNSGDLGFVWNQHLILTGREKEMIVVNGANYYCFELEQVVSDLVGVLPTFVAATGVSLQQGDNSDELVMFYVPDQTEDLATLERKMMAQVAESFGVNPYAVLPVEQEAFYKTTSGKIQRGQFKKLFEKDFYRAELSAFQQRHQQQKDALDTLFVMDWYCLPKIGTASCVELSLEQESELKKALQQPPSNQLAVLLRGFSATADLADNLFCIVREMGHLVRLIKAVEFQQSLLIQVPCQTQVQAQMVKPLLETLRQETGNETIYGQALVSGTQIRLSTTEVFTWDNHGEQFGLRLRNLKPADIHSKSGFKKGVYWITGGLGGLAESLLDSLIKQGIHQVLITGRTALSSNPQRQSRFNQLQAGYPSIQLHYEALSDWGVTNIEQLVARGCQALGDAPLQGVFHLAGHLAMEPLQDIDEAHWQQIVEAKVVGTEALIHYLEQHWPNSVLVQYGSVNGFFGGANAAAYSAACAAQIALTNEINQRGKISGWSFNWSLWEGTGMAAKFSYADVQMARNKGFIPIPVEASHSLLSQLMCCSPGNYFIGLDSNNAELKQQLDQYYWSKEQLDLFVEGSTDIDKEIIKAALQASFHNPAHCIQTPEFHTHITQEAFIRNEHGQVQTRMLQQSVLTDSPAVLPANATEQALADIWSQVLGKPVMDVSRTFFEYGGHSINATQVVAAINQRLEQQLTVAHLFQYASVEALAGLIDGGQTLPQDWLALGLQDFLQRADRFRLDPVNPSVHSERSIVFLPTALGIASAYGPMITSLAKQRSFVLSLPVGDTERSGSLEQAAQQSVRLLQEHDLINTKTVLVGWSIAGVLGYEILRLLAAKAQPLPALVMLDSGFNKGLHEITWDQEFQQLMFAVELGLGVEKFAEFNQQKEVNIKLHWLQQYLATIGIEVTEQSLVEWWQAYQKRMQSLLNYQVHELLANARISLLKAAFHTHGRSDLGWPDNNNKISWSSIQADHQGIVNHPETLDWMKHYLQ